MLRIACGQSVTQNPSKPATIYASASAEIAAGALTSPPPAPLPCACLLDARNSVHGSHLDVGSQIIKLGLERLSGSSGARSTARSRAEPALGGQSGEPWRSLYQEAAVSTLAHVSASETLQVQPRPHSHSAHMHKALAHTPRLIAPLKASFFSGGDASCAAWQ